MRFQVCARMNDRHRQRTRKENNNTNIQSDAIECVVKISCSRMRSVSVIRWHICEENRKYYATIIIIIIISSYLAADEIEKERQ